MLLVSCRVITGVTAPGRGACADLLLCGHLLNVVTQQLVLLWKREQGYSRGDGVQEWLGSVCAQVRQEAAGCHQHTVCLQEQTHESGHLFPGTWVLQEWCRVWSVAPSSQKHAELWRPPGEGYDTEEPKGCKCPYAHSFSSWLGTRAGLSCVSSEHRSKYKAQEKQTVTCKPAEVSALRPEGSRCGAKQVALQKEPTRGQGFALHK